MSGLILEIQRAAMDQNTSLVTLLRQAQVAASKLRLPSLEAWIGFELNGYNVIEELPDYRLLHGRPVAFNPYRGWIPIIMPSAELNEKLSTVPVYDSVAALEALPLTSSEIHMTIPTEMVRMLNSALSVPFGRMVVKVAPGQIAHILETTRGRVLDWALKLEEAGVTGEGLSFSQEERAIAQSHAPSIHIENSGTMVGAVGVGNATREISVGTLDTGALSAALQKISKGIDALVAEGVSRRELLRAIEQINTELQSSKPRQGFLLDRVEDLKVVLQGAGGNMLAAGAIHILSNAMASG